MIKDFPVKRANYIITDISIYNRYELTPLNKQDMIDNFFEFFSVKKPDIVDKLELPTSILNKSKINIVLEFFSVEKPNIGDILELPVSMLIYYEDNQIIQNHMLSFGKPDINIAFPDGFNIQEDYAYLTYTKTDKRVWIQRFYG